MKKNFLLIMIIVISLTSCQSVGTGRDNSHTITKSFSEALNAPEKEELLKERIAEFWEAFVKEDYEKIYNIYDPFFRARTPNKHSFFATLGMIKYHEYKIQDIKIEGNIARVKVDMVYSLTNIRVRTQVFNQPPTQAEIEETWLYVYDNWYKEYYSEAMGAGLVEY